MFCLISPPLGRLENEYVRILLVNLKAFHPYIIYRKATVILK